MGYILVGHSNVSVTALQPNRSCLKGSLLRRIREIIVLKLIWSRAEKVSNRP